MHIPRFASGAASRRNGLLIALAAVLIALTFFEGVRAGADKVLPGPMQRHRDAIAIALTLLQYGKWFGYASYKSVNLALDANGLSLQPAEVRPLGLGGYIETMRRPDILDHAIAVASSLKDPAGRGLYFLDANEKGMAIYYIISFVIFGRNVAGFFYTYILLLSVSAAIFAATFRRRTDALMFLTAVLGAQYVAVLACQDLAGNVGAIHSSRFLSVLTIPGMFQLMLLSRERRPLRTWVALGAAVQVLLMVLVLNARTTEAWEFIAVFALAGALAACHLLRRKRAIAWPAVWPSGLLVAGLLVFQVHQATALNRHYLGAHGTSGHIFWHNVATALHNNPLRTERFGIPSDLSPFDDRISYYLFEREIAARGLPLSDFLLDDGEWKLRTSDPRYDYIWPRYDAVLEDVVLRQIAEHPAYALRSFFVYQPISAARALAALGLEEWRKAPLWPLLLLALGPLAASRRAGAGHPHLGLPVAIALIFSFLPSCFAAASAFRLIDFMTLLLAASLAAALQAETRLLRGLLGGRRRAP